MPVAPPAPERFSTTTVCLSSRPSASATGRATVSATPPGGKGHDHRDGLVGRPVGLGRHRAAGDQQQGGQARGAQQPGVHQRFSSAKLFSSTPSRRSRCAPRRHAAASAAGQAHAHAGRCAGGDDVAGCSVMPREQVSISVGMSKIMSVVRASWRNSPFTQQRTRVSRAVDLVGGDHPRAHRAEGVEALAQVPLLVAHLHVARGDVVDDGVAEHMLQGIGAGCCGRRCR
jgi:hypothetical protein